jgi:hypothetical protein
MAVIFIVGGKPEYLEKTTNLFETWVICKAGRHNILLI